MWFFIHCKKSKKKYFMLIKFIINEIIFPKIERCHIMETQHTELKFCLFFFFEQNESSINIYYRIFFFPEMIDVGQISTHKKAFTPKFYWRSQSLLLFVIMLFKIFFSRIKSRLPVKISFARNENLSGEQFSHF